MKLSISLAAALLTTVAVSSCSGNGQAGSQVINDTNTPLHLLQPDYKIPYGVPAKEDIKADLDRILAFLETATPAVVTEDGKLQQGSFRLASYEWGVTYSAMLKAGEVTGDQAFTDYTVSRHSFLAEQAPKWTEIAEAGGEIDGQMRQVVAPKVLDDAGAVCVSMIRDMVIHPELGLRSIIDHYMEVIENEYRLDDGTLARNRPLPNAVWLDDMFMGVPAMAWYGKMTADISTRPWSRSGSSSRRCGFPRRSSSATAGLSRWTSIPHSTGDAPTAGRS